MIYIYIRSLMRGRGAMWLCNRTTSSSDWDHPQISTIVNQRDEINTSIRLSSSSYKPFLSKYLRSLKCMSIFTTEGQLGLVLGKSHSEDEWKGRPGQMVGWSPTNARLALVMGSFSACNPPFKQLPSPQHQFAYNTLQII